MKHDTYCFSENIVKKYLSASDFKKYKSIIYCNVKMDLNFAKSFAKAIKKWATKMGVTHYTHWFVPLNGKPLEKLVSFTTLKDGKKVVNFEYNDLLSSEVDASSFPCGNSRSTSNARGYVVWDVTSPVFILKKDVFTIMYIPAMLCTNNGICLDYKTPLVRSASRLNKVATNLLNMIGIKCNYVTPQVGIEQEYFLVPKVDADLRLDIKLAGRVVLEDSLIKSQSTEQHYFSMSNRAISKYMSDVNAELSRVGVDVQIQHSEVAPNQFEIVPKFSNVSIACDNNHLAMNIIENIAEKHGFKALFHEKPFKSVNGSGKHNNWSLATDGGVNLFNCDNKKVNNLFMVALISAVHEYDYLLRVCTATRGNELRLGGNEAPPAIISIYVGDDFELHSEDGVLNLGVSTLPELKVSNCDRNRTSPFAFTGNKWEFRMVGSSQSCAFSNTILNTILSSKLTEYCDVLKNSTDIDADVEKLVKKEYDAHNKIIFNGDNYSLEWVKEARKRGLYIENNISKIYDTLLSEKTSKLFEDMSVMSRDELKVYNDCLMNNYSNSVITEGKVLLSMLNSVVIPNTHNWTKNSYFGKECTVVINALITNAKKLNKLLSAKVSITTIYSIVGIMDIISKLYLKLSPYLPKELLSYPSSNELLF